MTITENLETILGARYGRDVRQAIHDGIKQAYDDGTANGNANMEVSQARGSYPTLGERLDETTAQLAQKATKGEISVGDIDKNKGKFDQTYMSEELLQQMAGDTPINAVTADNSLTTQKFVDKAITSPKLSDNYGYRRKLTEANDLDVITQNGHYNIDGKPLNMPSGAVEYYNTMIVLSDTGSDRKLQIIFPTHATSTNSYILYRRLFVNGSAINTIWRDLLTLNSKSISQDLLKTNYIHDTYDLPINYSNTRVELVDDFEGFRSPSGKLAKVSSTSSTWPVYAMLKKRNLQNVKEIAMEYYVESKGESTGAVGQVDIVEVDGKTVISKENFDVPLNLGANSFVFYPKSNGANMNFGIVADGALTYYIRYVSVRTESSATSLVKTMAEDDLINFKSQFSKDGSLENGSWEIQDKTTTRLLVNKVLMIGDSLTNGNLYAYGARGQQINENPPYYLSRLSGWEVENAGWGGITAVGWHDTKLSDYDYSNYDTFIIGLGTNGGLNGTETDLTTNYGAYCAIIDKIKTDNPQAHIFLVDTFNVDTNVKINQIATKFNLPVIEEGAIRADASAEAKMYYHAENDLHFTRVGNVRKAENIFNQMCEYMYQHLLEYDDEFTLRPNDRPNEFD